MLWNCISRDHADLRWSSIVNSLHSWRWNAGMSRSWLLAVLGRGRNKEIGHQGPAASVWNINLLDRWHLIIKAQCIWTALAYYSQSS
jgi:hypothetical protein